MSDSPKIVILSTRDVVRFGLLGMLGALGPGVRIAFHLDPSAPTDVVVVDATGTAGSDAVQLEIATVVSSAPVVVLTSGPVADGFADWDQPVFAYVTVAATADEVAATVAQAIRSARRGRNTRTMAAAPAATRSGLSKREIQVLAAMAGGRTNAEIAAELFLGINTVKTYIRTAYRKIGVESRSQAVIWALDHGLGAGGVGIRDEVPEERAAEWAGDDVGDS